MSDAYDILAKEMLPRSGTAWMRAHLASMLKAFDFDPLEIARQSDADTADADKLPFLAFDKGLKVWSDNWSEERQRWVVKHGYTLARLQGTPLGIEIFINLFDGYVIEELLPPARSFAISEGHYDHEALIAEMPQIRLYHNWPDTEFPDFAFVSRDFVGETFVSTDRAMLLPRYPVLWDRGVETPLGLADFSIDGKTGLLTPPSERGYGLFVGDFVGYQAMGPTYAVPALQFDLNDKTLKYMAGTPEHVPAAAFAGEAFTGYHHVMRDLGVQGAYDRIVLWDTSRFSSLPASSQAAAHAGVDRLGLRPYHILLHAAFPGYPAALPNTWNFVGAGFAISFDPTTIGDPFDAIASTRRAGDRVWVNLLSQSNGGQAAELPQLD